LCFVFCVLCFVFCVLCFVFCVLCFVFCVLCFVFCVLLIRVVERKFRDDDDVCLLQHVFRSV